MSNLSPHCSPAAGPFSAPDDRTVLQQTLHALHLLLAEPPHSHAGTWSQQRQRALLWRNRQRLPLLAGFRADGSVDVLCEAMRLTAP